MDNLIIRRYIFMNIILQIGELVYRYFFGGLLVVSIFLKDARIKRFVFQYHIGNWLRAACAFFV